MTAVFITATGTDIGKTFIARGLIATLRARGRNVEALKPVITGLTDSFPVLVQFNESDLAFLRRLLARPDADLQVFGDEIPVAARKDTSRGRWLSWLSRSNTNAKSDIKVPKDVL